MDGALNLPQITAPGSAPSAGRAYVTVGADGRLYITLPNGVTLPVGNELFVDQATQTISAAVASQALVAATLFARLTAKFIFGAGSGAYSANLFLPVANMLAAGAVELNIELPAGSNPTVNIYDTSTGGALLATIVNPAPTAAAYWFGRFKFGQDAHWHKQFSLWN